MVRFIATSTEEIIMVSLDTIFLHLNTSDLIDIDGVEYIVTVKKMNTTTRNWNISLSLRNDS